MANNWQQVVLTGVFLLISSAAAEQEPVVATQAGSVRGTTLKSLLGNEFFSFKGEYLIVEDAAKPRYALNANECWTELVLTIVLTTARTRLISDH